MKKTNKIILLVILIIVLLFIGIYYKNESKKAYDAKIAELESQITELKKQSEEQQEIINNTKNNKDVTNEDVDKNTENEKLNEDKKQNEKLNEDKKQNGNLNEDEKQNEKLNEKSENDSKNILYELTSGDRNAVKGNPEILYIYKLNDSEIEFKYHAAWNENDITGTAKGTDNKVYTYEKGNKKIEFKMVEDGIEITEYNNGMLESECIVYGNI